jgi:hypothetical protein
LVIDFELSTTSRTFGGTLVRNRSVSLASPAEAGSRSAPRVVAVWRRPRRIGWQGRMRILLG